MLALTTNPRDHALLRLLYAAGLRVSEVVALTWTNVQPRGERGQVTVFGKGGKTPSILISAATYQELLALRGPSWAPVFASRGGGAAKRGGPLHRSQVLRLIQAAARRTGMDGHVSPHRLRHAHASHVLDRGAPLSLVRETLGHASIAVTGRFTRARPSASSSEYLAV
jgi:integrase/recombinase XerD